MLFRNVTDRKFYVYKCMVVYVRLCVATVIICRYNVTSSTDDTVVRFCDITGCFVYPVQKLFRTEEVA